VEVDVVIGLQVVDREVPGPDVGTERVGEAFELASDDLPCGRWRFASPT
jgi:hypothetical protein